MPDVLALAQGAPGLAMLAALTFCAGAVYGFAGFGAALLFMPLATLIVPPVVAVAALSVAAPGSAITVLPEAWRQSDRRAAAIMLGAAVVFAPAGIWILRVVDPVLIRWAVSAIVLATLAALLTGWRYRAVPGPRTWGGVGAGVGLVGGATGLNGPVLVLFQLAGGDPAARTRANAIVVLTLSSIAFLPIFALQGALPIPVLLLGLALFVPYALGTLVGRCFFEPERATLYRGIAYGIIGTAGVLGLPVFG